MRAYRCAFVVAWAVSLVAPAASAQRAPECSPAGMDVELAERALVREGFEDVYVCVVSGEAVVHFEDRIYRYPVTGLQAVRKALEPFLSAGVVTVALVPHDRGVPLGTWRFPRFQPETAAAVEAQLGVRPRPTTGRKRNSQRFRVDLVVHPEVDALLGSVDDAVMLRLAVAPALTTSLWTGMELTGQVVVSLIDEIGDTEWVRPGIVAASQTVRLPANTFATLSAGYFSNERYGLDMLLRHYALNGRVFAAGRVGRTGFARLQDGTWFYGPANTTTAQVSAGAVVLPQPALTAEVGYGRYLLGDDALTFGLSRRFGQVQMGFLGILAGDDLNLEARIVLPLPMPRHLRPMPFRPRVADRFAWAYRYRRLTQSAESYETAPGAPDLLGPLNPAVFRPLLQQEVNAEREAVERARADRGL